MAESFQKFKINYDIAGKDPKEIERLIAKAVDEVVRKSDIKPENVKIFPARNQTNWELTLETAPDSPSFDGSVSVCICGVRADDDPDELSQPQSGLKPFRPGQTDVFDLQVDKDIGDIFKIRITFPKSVQKGEWRLKSMKLLHPRNKDVFSTDCNLTFRKTGSHDPTQEVFVVWPDYPLLPQVNYHVFVHTADKSGAMNCGADVVLHGDYGNSGQRNLRSSEPTKFQPGQVNLFIVPVIKLGQVRKVRLINDLSGSQTTWMVEKVVVKEPPEFRDPQEWEFKCGRYFDPTKGDNKFDRILQPGKEPEDPEPPEVPEPLPEPPAREPTPPPKPKTPEPEPEPEPEPLNMEREEPQPKPQPPKEEKKKVEKAETPTKKTDKDLWMIWWENRSEQVPHQSVPLTFVVVGDKSQTGDINIEMDLKPGESDKRKVKFSPDQVGPVDKVRFRFGEAVKAKGLKWEIAKLHLKHVASEETHTFEFQKPVVYKDSPDQTVEASRKGIPISIYEVELHTGDRDGLFSSDVKAKILLRGEDGDTGERTVVNAPVEGKLKSSQKGSVLKFEIEGVDIGEIKGVAFTHNKPDMVTADFLSRIVVRPKNNAKDEYVLNFDRKKPIQKPSAKPDSPLNQWNLWWENREAQQEYQGITLGFIVVGEKEATRQFDFVCDLRPGDSDKKRLEFEPQKVGPIVKVRIKFGDEVAKKTKWEISRLHLQHIQSGDLHSFEFEKPAVKKAVGDSTVEVSEKGIPISIYEVELHTGDRTELFGHDVRAKILIRGKNGDTGERTAVNAKADGPIKIKLGGVLRFDVEGVDIGEIKGVVFTHNQPGKETAEFVERIVVRPVHDRSAEYVIEFDAMTDASPNAWQLWWENHYTQPVYKDVGLSFTVVGENGNSDPFDFTDLSLRPGRSERLEIEFDMNETGPVEKVRIKFADAVRYKTKWNISKLHLLRLMTSEKHTFEFDKPAVKKEGCDNVIEASAKGIPLTIHLVELHTGDRKGMFDRDVHAKVIIRGTQGDTGKRSAYRSNDPTFPKIHFGSVISCEVEGVDIGEVKACQFIHNKPGQSPGDFIQKIIVKPLHLPGTEYKFEFEKKQQQAAAPSGPTITVEQQLPNETADPREWIISWTNYDIQPKDALQISVILFGDKGETPPYFLDVELGPNESKEYKMIVKEEVGELEKLRFGHGPKTQGDHPWKVQEVRMKHVATGMLHRFIMGAPPKPPSAAPKYRIEIYMRRSATDVGAKAKVYIKLKGQRLITDKCWLHNSLNNTIRFKPGQMDVFEVDDAPDVGDIMNITFGGPDERIVAALRSYITKVIVVPLHWRTRKEFVFNFNNDTPANSAAPPPRRPWNIRVKTGNFPTSKTQTPLTMALCGRYKTTELMALKQSNGFSPNQVHSFRVELEDIEEVFKIRLGFQDWSKKPTLYIEEVYVEAAQGPGPQYIFPVGDWIWGGFRHDSWREFLAKKTKLQLKVFKYQLAVWTGNIGADKAENGVQVFVEIYGSKGDSGRRRLANSKTHMSKFAANQMDLFDIEAIDFGDVQRIVVTMVTKDVFAKWQLARMLLQSHPLGGEEFIFDCNRIFDGGSNKSAAFPVTIRNDGVPYEPTNKDEYLLFVSTGPGPDMSTMCAVSLTLFGDRGPTNPMVLVKAKSPITTSGKKLPPPPTFRPGAVDSFPVIVPANIGNIVKARIEHNNVGTQRDWFLDKFSLQNLSKSREQTYHFDVDGWLSERQEDGETVRECPAFYFEKPAALELRYEITFTLGPKTSTKLPPGVSVHATLCGKSPLTSGKRCLRKPSNGTPFLQPNAQSSFVITAVGVGECTRVIVGHDAPGIDYQIEINHITVTWEGAIGGRNEFPVNKLLAKPHPTKDAELIVDLTR